MKIATRLMLLMLLTNLLIACSQDESSQSNVEVLPIQVLLSDSLSLNVTELPGEALPVWRTTRGNKPTLLLLAGNPMMQAPPAKLKVRIEKLLDESVASELVRQADPVRNPNPLLLPDMTVDVALRAGWFSELVWVVPHTDEHDDLSGTMLRDQLRAAGLINEEESIGLVTDNGTLLSGRLRGVPFRAVTLDTLPHITTPVVLHVDQNWFRDSYRTEIATPMLGLLFNTLGRLREHELSIVAATFCAGNLDHRISLDVRFAKDLLVQAFNDPGILDQAPPQSWQWIKEILYLQNFMQKEMVRERSQQIVAISPEKAWVHFVAYRAAADMRESSNAMSHLAEAVRLDPVYALEYRELMQRAYDFGDLKGAMRMLEHAGRVLSDNLEIRLEMAWLANDMNDYGRAKNIVRELLELEWSDIYFPQTPDYLRDFLAHLDRSTLEMPSSETGINSLNEKTPRNDIQTGSVRERILHPSQSR